MNLNQVTLPSLDIERSIAFYKTLGLHLIVKALPHYARFLCPDGTSTLSVHLVNTLGKGEGIMVYFECDNLDEKVAELIGKGILFDEIPADKRWLWRESRLTDPDGNRLVLYYAGSNRVDPPWKIQ